ncbi:MAG: PIN domain-containing protein [Bryobacteraceae bacterium]
MKEFFDTSVLVAAFWRGHRDHDASLDLVAGANRKNSACALHTLAEVYSTMTALPVKDSIPPDQAVLFVQEVRDRFHVVPLDESEYFATITECAERGFTSGRIYDALLLRCAAKIKAEVIYTWNLKHFQAIDPRQAARIQSPNERRPR